MNTLQNWTPVLYIDSDPPFVINMDVWQVQQFERLAKLPFTQSLQVVIISVPQLELQHWHEFQQIAERHIPEARYCVWQQIGNAMRRMLRDVWEMVNRYTMEQAVNCARKQLRTGTDLEQFAFMACLYYFRHQHLTANLLLSYLLQHLDQDTLNMQAVVDFYQCLTRRQRDVTQLAACGLTNTEIANQLYISRAVVAEHLTAIYLEFSAALELDTDTHGTRYRLIHWMTRLYQKHPEFMIQLNG